MSLTGAAVKHRTTVFVLVAFTILLGTSAYRSLPLEAAPDIPIPVVLVTTVYPGVAPADIESLVTNQLERELDDLKDVKRMTSVSGESVSQITIEFESEIDIDQAVAKVREKVDLAEPNLPPEAEAPQLTELNFSDFPIMLVNLYGSGDLVRLKELGEELADRMESVPGVLDVDIAGGLEREVRVELDPARMTLYAVSVDDILTRIAEEHRDTPGGTVELGEFKYLVRVPGEFDDMRRMEDIVVTAPDGRPVTIADLGRVVDGFADRASISRVNGEECVTLMVQKRSGANIVAVADATRALLEERAEAFPAGVQYLVRQDQSEDVREMVADLENSIVTGLALVVLVLLLVMGVRNALFVGVAIPLSMLLSFLVLKALGITLNMVVLFSLILALGMLVDNSIVVVENIFRHASSGVPRVKAALDATREVAWPIIASTATTVVVFAPLLFWPGIMGDWMVFLPITVITTLLASLFVALVVNPVVAASFLKVKPKRDTEGQEAERATDVPVEAPSGRLASTYARALRWSVRRPGRVLGMAALGLMGVLALFVRHNPGVELFPTTTPDRARVTITAPQGTAVERTARLADRVSRLAAAEPNVVDRVVSVGEGAGDAMGGGAGASHNATVELEFLDRHERTESTRATIERLRAELAKLAGAEFLVDVAEMGPPAGAPVAVELAGDDFETLAKLARRVAELVASVPGAVDVRDDYEPGKPEVTVTVDRELAKRRNVSTGLVASTIRTAINGTTAAKLRDGDDEVDIVVQYARSFREDLEDLMDIRVSGDEGVQVPLRDVARVETTPGVGAVRHTDRKRTITVSADVATRSGAEVLADVQAKLAAELELPPGYSLRYAGEHEEQEKAVSFLSEAFTVGVALILLILVTQFNSLLRPAIILASVAMSLFGVLLGLVITQNRFGIIMTGMGVISLAGVVVNNAIVLIDYIDQLRRRHGFTLDDALVRAGTVRARPVLLTAVTTVLGLLPMALGVSLDVRTLTIDAGASTGEWWGPLAQAVIFGLVFATVLTLVIVPVMYAAQERSTGWLKRQAARLNPAQTGPSVVEGGQEASG